MVRQHRPTLVLSDIAMPEMDGYQMCEAIKSDPELADIPVILLTSLTDPEDVILGLGARADNYVTKPYDEELLVARIENLLLNQQLRRESRTEIGIEFYLGGKKHVIDSSRRQILGLLISTFENAVHQQRQLQQHTAELEREISERRQAEARLNQTNEQLSVLLENLPVVPYTCRAEGDFGATYVSQQVKEVTGYVPEDLTSDAAFWADRIHPDDGRRVFAGLPALFARGKHEHEYRWRVADGSYRWFLDTLHLVRKPDGTLDHIAGAWVDITARKQAEEELQEREERFRAVVDNVVDGIITIDERGIVETVNPAAEKIFGYRAGELIGRNVKLLMPEPYHGEHDGYLANYRRTGEARVIGIGREVVGQRRDGSEFPLELAVSQMRVGERRMFTGIVRDITDRKQADEALRQAKEQAEEASHAKSDFLARMSHELRTPLNAVIGYSEMLQEEAEVLELDDFVPDLEKINAAGRHLLELINDVLDISKIEAGHMELFPEHFEVGVLVGDVATTAQPLVAKNGNALEVQISDDVGTMYADQTKLRQNLFNLLSNAAKFTEGGGISLEVVREADDGQDWLVFRVSDSGIGMRPEQQEKVFDSFVQADASTTRQYGGTGLGLAITKRFCEMMGGDIAVESEVGVRSTFTMRLPAEIKGPAAETTAEELAELREDGNVVLVIDDDRTMHDLLDRLLRKEGYGVVTASRGEEGLRLAREVKPVAITLDVMMPGMDGWEVLQKLKEDPELAEIPVILLTLEEDKNRGFALGATDYLIKPVNRRLLVELLRRHRPAVSPGRILVVEDDPLARELMHDILEVEGNEVVEAQNGKVALERLEEQVPDLILLDLMMPGMDGFEFVEAVRLNEVWRSIPVVVITAKELTAEDRQRLDGGVAMILEKGAQSHQELLEQIREQIQSA